MHKPIIHITDHAYKRSKERFSLSKKSLDRLAETAFLTGLTHSDANGKLKRYFDKLFRQDYTGNNIKIYGENIYLFTGFTLITLYQLPNEFKAIVRKLMANKNISGTGEQATNNTIMQDFITRLYEEKAQLDERREKLAEFQKSVKFQTIDPVQMSLLNIQAQVMDTYSQCLTERICWLSKPQADTAKETTPHES